MVASDERYDDETIFLSLIPIHHANQDILVLWLIVEDAVTQTVDEALLTEVGRENGDVVALIALIHKILGQANGILGLKRIGHGKRIVFFLFQMRMIEEKEVVRHASDWGIAPNLGTAGNALRKIMHGRQSSNLRAHTTLCRQDLVVQTSSHESFEERHVELEDLGEIKMRRLGLQLAMIADENELGHVGVQRSEDVRLQHLGSLFHHDDVRSHILN